MEVYLWTFRSFHNTLVYAPLLFPYSTINICQCDGFPDDFALEQIDGYIAGITSHGSGLLSRGWLVTVRLFDIPGTHFPYRAIQLSLAMDVIRPVCAKQSDNVNSTRCF